MSSVKDLLRGDVVDGSGTANYVSKWSDADTITNSVIYDDGTNVGIGTSSPSSKVHILESGTPFSSAAGTVAVFQRSGESYSGSVISIIGGNDGSSTLNFGDTDDENVGYVSYIHSDNYLTLGTNAAERLRIDSSGRVGIGTSSPADVIDIQKNQNATTNFYFRNTDTTDSNSRAVLNVDAGDVGLNLEVINGDHSYISASSNLYSMAGSQSIFFTGGSERMRITSSGNVGIGTGSPAAKLDVNGDALINSLTVGRGGSNVSTNTAVGLTALGAATSGSNNTGIGYLALEDNTTGSNNTAVGLFALRNNTTAGSNTAIGVQALDANTTASNNTAVGASALTSNTTALNNTSVGFYSSYYNTEGADNTALGSFALHNNTTASNNTAIGKSALSANTTGASNTAVGYQALVTNTTSENNTALGRSALQANTGAGNSGFGMNSLLNNTSGEYNTAVGTGAMDSNSTGTQNTAIGVSAGDNITTGSNNIVIGYLSDANTATTSNEITLGNSSITTLRCQTQTISALSDARDKKDVKELEGAEAFIKELRPVSFVWNQRDGKRLGLEDNGFIAQELLEAQEKTGYKVPNLVLDTNPDKLQAAYAALLPTMVSALQSALNKIELLEAKIQTLESK
jgi:trimeric autotransporter adhesin